MADSIHATLRRVQDLLAVTKLTTDDVRRIEINRWSGIEFFIDVVALARLAREFNMRREKVEIVTLEDSVHVSFRAKGAIWVGCLLRNRVEEFFQAMGVDPTKRLTAVPKAIGQKQLLLTAKE